MGQCLLLISLRKWCFNPEREPFGACCPEGHWAVALLELFSKVDTIYVRIGQDCSAVLDTLGRAAD